MDSEMKSPPADNAAAAEAKAATFRKPSGDVANRNYRRRSPVNNPASFSSDESTKRERSSSPITSKVDPVGVPEHRQRRKEADRELDKDKGWSHYGRSGDSYGHSDKRSSRNYYGHSRHNDYGRHEKHSNDERRHQQSSSHSGRESRGVRHSSHSRQEIECGESKDYMQNADKYSPDRYDNSDHRNKDREKEPSSVQHQKLKDRDSSPDRSGSSRKHANSISEKKDRERHVRDKDGRGDRRDYYRSSRDHKGDRVLHNEESRGYRNDTKDPKKKREDLDTNRDKDRYNKALAEDNEAKLDVDLENRESLAKKPKFPVCNSESDREGDVFDENQSLSSKQVLENGVKGSAGPARADNSEAANDLNAAKVAAMKAAEIVNRNLAGVGLMSTEQKKKLLWGSKKSTTSEESAHQWDTSLFGDRDRQEKFNKLMGVKGNVNVDHKPDDAVQAEKQKELQMDLEKQYTAGLRRRDGRTVGLGL